MERYFNAKSKASSAADSPLAQASAEVEGVGDLVPGAAGLAGKADVLSDQFTAGLLQLGGGFEGGQRVCAGEAGGVLGGRRQLDAGERVAAEAEDHVPDGSADLLSCGGPDVVRGVVVTGPGVVSHAGCLPVRVAGGDEVAGCSGRSACGQVVGLAAPGYPGRRLGLAGPRACRAQADDGCYLGWDQERASISGAGEPVWKDAGQCPAENSRARSPRWPGSSMGGTSA